MAVSLRSRPHPKAPCSWRRTLRVGAALLTLAGTGACLSALTLAPPGPAFADGPAPCSVGGPPFPDAGFCATYSGANTWYGSYGPGFPTAEGWAFCADPPASGGDYPAPAYHYEPAAAPAGADLSQGAALGFAFSEAQALGWWGGSPGAFTADQAAVAGKLLYDAVVWHSPVPSMDPGVGAAYNDIDGWFEQALGSQVSPVVTTALLGGGSTFTGSATVQAAAAFPDTGAPLTGLGLVLSVSGGSFESATGPTSLIATTDGSGTVAVPVYADTPGPVSVTVSVPGGLGQSGLDFFAPTADELDAQGLAAFSSPVAVTVGQALTALPTTGTVSVVKSGNDTAYYPLGGAVFQVLQGPTVVASLTTAADGTAGPSAPIDAGTYEVHEESAPPGYGTAPDQPVTVTAGTNTEIDFTGDEADQIVPATLSIEKQDADTGAPLAGATFDLRFDASNDGTFGTDLGTCTTDPSGSCTPPGNDGTDRLLPGDYEVVETAAPPGYGIPTPASQEVDLVPGENGTVTFGDPRLVSAVFAKTATGNINPAELSLAGAVFSVTEATPAGPSVARCSTDATGTCATATVLVSGSRYCWAEIAAPAGLTGGASGCFTAADTQADQPITVSDAGTFVAVAVRKVDAANPAVGLPGAVFDLYRIVPAPTASVGGGPVPQATNEALVATTTTGDDGIGTFALQLPGYAYCAQEVTAPPNYVADTTAQCTGVLSGTATVPAPVTTLTFNDAEQTVELSVRKYNAEQPSLVIPGATYDLYVEGAPPPSGVPGQPPDDVVPEAGDTWYERGTTGAEGTLAFTVPAGYAWCVREVTAPPNYALDPTLHCTPVLTVSSSAAETTIAVPESLVTVHLSAFKYNSEQPDTVIPGATYELLAEGPPPPGAPQEVPAGALVPSGDTFFGEGTTDTEGVLSFAVPAGFKWCLHELDAPPQYEPDPAFHCTAQLDADATSAATTIAVPEMPVAGTLAYTGLPTLPLGLVGGGAVAVGGATLVVERRRPRRARRGRRST